MGFLMLVDNLRIKFHWGVYQVQALSLEAAENKEKSGVFLALNLFKTI